VRRLLLHLAGATGLLSLYLAWVPASHQGWRTAAIIAALVMIAVSGLLLAWPQAGRPGANPYAPAPAAARRGASNKPGSFDVAACSLDHLTISSADIR
jgi:hypothetical protein